MAQERDTRNVRPVSAAAVKLRAVLAAALADHDKSAIVRTAVEAVGGTVGIAELYRDVLTPLLIDSGSSWQRGHTAVWEEHLVSAAVRTIVEILYPGVLKQRAVATPAGRSVLLACPSGEAHDLGLRMIADRFDMAGWTTYYLGADTPVDEIVDAAVRLDVDVVALSASTHFQRLSVGHAVDALAAAVPGVRVLVGGAACGGPSRSAPEAVALDELLSEG